MTFLANLKQLKYLKNVSLAGLGLLSLLCFQACDDLVIGAAPQFDGIQSAAALGESQIELRWNPGTDDIGDGTFEVSDELRYAIWYASGSETIDLERSPTVVTQEGALSYVVSGLDADTSYSVIVRARDRGNQYSDNTATMDVRTENEGEGAYKAPVSEDFSFDPGGAIHGFAFNRIGEDVGLIDGNEIVWFSIDGNNNLMDASSRTTLQRNILEAFLVRADSTRMVPDLFLLTDNNLIHFENTGNGFDTGDAPFGQVPAPGSLRFATNANRLLTAVSFRDNSGQPFIYSRDEDDMFVAETAPSSLGSSGLFLLAFLDGNEFIDLVTWSSAGLRRQLDDGEDYVFDSAGTIDDLDYDAARHQLLTGDADGDGNLDLVIYERQESSQTTRILVFLGDGEGVFDPAIERDLDGAYLVDPELSDVDGDGADDLFMVQTRANNLVLYPGGASPYSAIAQTAGGGGPAGYGFFLNLDAELPLDVAVISIEDQTLTSAVANPQ